jgi:hypothetical protein
VQHRHGRGAVLLEYARDEPRARLQVDGKAEGELVRNPVEHEAHNRRVGPGCNERRAQLVARFVADEHGRGKGIEGCDRLDRLDVRVQVDAALIVEKGEAQNVGPLRHGGNAGQTKKLGPVELGNISVAPQPVLDLLLGTLALPLLAPRPLVVGHLVGPEPYLVEEALYLFHFARSDYLLVLSLNRPCDTVQLI